MIRTSTHAQRGYYLIGLLIVLVILFILYGNQLLPDKTTGKSQATYSIDKAKDSSCLLNRTTMNTQLTTWAMSHPGQKPTIETLQQSGISIPICPAHGVYSFGDDGTIYCSVHYPMPTPAGAVPGAGMIPSAVQTPPLTPEPTVGE
jgi:competence protein ComGC